MLSIFQSDIDKAVTKLKEAGVDVIAEDYVIVVGKDTSFYRVGSHIPVIVKDYCPKGVWYLVKRKDLEK